MKKVFGAIGSALGYLMLFLGVQFVVSLLIMLVIIIQTVLGAMPYGYGNEFYLISEAMDAIFGSMMLIALISDVITVLVLWLIFFCRRKSFLGETQICRFPVGGIVPIILFGFSANILVSFLLSIVPLPQSWLDSYFQNVSLVVNDKGIIAWIAAVVAAPIAEELIFRGLIYTRLKRAMPSVLAAVISSLLFGIAHGTILWAISTFLIGMLLIWLFETFHSLLASILAHSALNLIGMLPYFDNEMSDTEGWIWFAASLLVFVASAVWVILFMRKKKSVPLAGPQEGNMSPAAEESEA